MKTKEPLQLTAAQLADGRDVKVIPAPKKRPSALRRAVHAVAEHVAEALNMKVWTELNEELTPAKKQNAEALRALDILERNDDAEVLEEVSPFIQSTLERDAHKRILKHWWNTEEGVLSMGDYARLGDRIKLQMVGEGYLRSFMLAESTAKSWETACGARARPHHDPAMVQLAQMARAMRGQ